MSDIELNTALDRYTVPPLSPRFADRVMLAAETRQPEGGRWTARRGRVGWGRRAGIISGGVAFGLLSAAAAATGYLGEPVRHAVREAPVIGPIIARVDPPAPKPKPVAPTRIARPAPKPAPAAPTVARDNRRTAIVEDIRERMQRRAQDRAQAGLPPQRPRVQLREAMLELPPEKRVELIRQIRETRRERLSERWRLRQERRARWLEQGQQAEPESARLDEGNFATDR